MSRTDSSFLTALPRSDHRGMLTGEYVVGDKLGETPHHRLYLGRSLIGGRHVEIKIMRTEWRDWLRRRGAWANPYMHELHAALDLGPNLVPRHLDVGTTPAGEHYLVRERVEGRRGAAVAEEKGRFEVPAACYIIADLAASAERLHQLGLAGLNVSLDNITLTQGDGDYLWDARVDDLDGIEPHGTEGAVPPDDLARAEVYITPEEAKAAPLSGAMDMYRLGALLYRLLTGIDAVDLPNAKASQIADYLRGGGRVPKQKLKYIVSGAGDEVELMITKCLKESVAERPGNIDQLVRGLHHVVKEWAKRNRDVKLSNELWHKLSR